MTDRKQRRTLHLACPADTPAVAPPEVRRLEWESDKHYADRCAMVAWLGPRWLRSSEYVFRPINSTNPEIWKPAHALWWERVHVAAALDRAKNPACQRAASVRAALGD